MADLADQAKKYVGLFVACFILVSYFIRPLEEENKKNYQDIQELKQRVMSLELNKAKIDLLEMKMNYENEKLHNEIRDRGTVK